MAKQLNVNLSFTADTAAAKKQIQELQESLQKVAQMPNKSTSLFDDTKIRQANNAAMELQQHLQNAVNIDTGKIDLSRFSTSLKASNKDLNTYYKQLVSAGETGQQAFLQLAKSISTAEAPVTRVNAKLAEMGTVLKNTARWQLSSSILHGFMGTLQSAYNYAQDLNESLNNIRIVTGQTTDQMASFAEKANQAAKELSTTTTAYTDAALIFYQQGLGDKEVEERTNAVIKMANVTGDSATEVSSYMTAIWNNFDDGSESLEHYADVITALGASTASSSSEIAEGLSKFASIGDTIGLSYDYATSILAALVANTRQSADVIGTSLRTIFARLQGLSLGETLEDGVNLNKYSKALDIIGVDILNMNGELKTANEILDETATKWDTLTQAQQTALAQTVAGTRQYAQFVAMMEGWEDVQTNLETAAGSEGTLQKQADIYAESWEAARDRVRAAAESLYNDLLDDDFFININNIFAKIINGADDIIDSVGGLGGVLTSVGSIFLSLYASKMPSALNDLKQNFMVVFGQAQKLMLETQQTTLKTLTDLNNKDDLSLNFKTQAEGIARVNEMQQRLILSSKNLTEAEKASYQIKMQNVQALYEEATAIAKNIEKQQEELKTLTNLAATSAITSFTKKIDDYTGTFDTENVINSKMESATDEEARIRYQKLLDENAEAQAKLDVEITKTIKSLFGENNEIQELITKLINASDASEKLKIKQELIGKAKGSIDNITKEYIKQAEQVDILLNKLSIIKDQSKEWKTFAKEIEGNSNATKDFYKQIESTINAFKEVDINQNGGKLAKNFDQAKEELDKCEGSAIKMAEVFENLRVKIETPWNARFESLYNDFDKIESQINALDGDTQVITQIKTKLNELTAEYEKLNNKKEKGRKLSEENPLGKFSMSTALTQFASAAMAVSGLINSLQSLSKVFDEDATASERFSAAASILMTSMMAVNSISRLSTTLLRNEAMAKTANTIATKLFGKAVFTASGEVVKGATAVQAAIPPLLIITGACVGLIAAIKGISLVIKNAQAQSVEGKLKAAQEQAKAFAEALDEAKTKAEGLQSAFDNYSSVIDTLNNCTKGTQEWRDALKEASASTAELLQEYPELLKQANLFDENGLINLDVLEQAVTDANNITDNLNAASLMAQAKVNEAQLDVDVKNYAKSQDRYSAKDSNNQSYTDYDFAKRDLQNLLNDYKNFGDGVLDETDAMKILYDKTEGLTTAQEETARSLYQLAEKAIAAGNAVDNASLSMVNDWAKDNNVNLQADQAKLMQTDYQKRYNEMEADLDRANKDDSRFDNESTLNQVGDTKKTIWQLWNEANGTDYHLQSNGVRGGTNNRTFHYIDENNDEKQVSYEEMKTAIAATSALQALGNSAKEAAKNLATIDANAGNKEFSEGIRNWVANGNFESMSKKDLDALEAEMKKQGIENYLDNVFGDGKDGLSNDEAKEYGFDSAQELIDAFTKDIDNTQIAFNSLISSTHWLDETISRLKEVDQSDWSLENRRDFGNKINQLIADGDIEAVDALTAAISQAGEHSDEFAGILNDIDWANITPVELADKLKEVGYESGYTTEDLQTLIDAMSSTGAAAGDLASKYAAQHGVIDGLSDGGTIKSDDYDKLDTAYQSYFTKMLDGSYKLVGAAEDLQNALKADQIEDYTNQIANLEQENLRSVQAQMSVENFTSNANDATGFDSLAQSQHYQSKDGKDVYDSEGVQEQLAYLQQLSEGNAELQYQIQEWKKDLADNTVETKTLQEIADTVNNTRIEYENFSSSIESNNAEIQGMYNQIAFSAEDMKELNQMLEEGTVNVQAYNAAALEMDRVNDTSMLDADEWSDYADYIQEAADNMEGFNDEMNDTEAAIVAKGIMKMNKAIETLADNFVDAGDGAESWKDILENSTSVSEEYEKAMTGTQEAVAELLDVSKDYVSDDFVKGHLEEIEAAATGNADAIDNLKAALAEDVTSNLADSLAGSAAEAETLKAELMSLVEDVPNVDVGVSLHGDDEFVQALNNMIAETGMTVDQVNALCDSMGFEANFDTEPQTVSGAKIPGGYVIDPVISGGFSFSEDGISMPTITANVRPLPAVEAPEGYVNAFAMTTDGSTPKINSVTKKASGSANNRSSSNSGGSKPKSSGSGGKGNKGKGGKGGKGSGSNKREEKDPIEDLPDAYHDVTRAIKRVTSAVEKLEKKQSHLHGKELIESLKQENSLLQQQAKNYEWLSQVIDSEKNRIQDALSAYGVTFDKNTGEMTNYAEAYQSVVDSYNNMISAYNSSGQSDSDKKLLEKAQKSYDKFKDLLDEYDETLDKQLENEANQLENLYTQIGNNYTAWQTQIQITLDLSTARQEWQKFWQKVNKDIKSAFTDYAKEIGNLSSNFDLRSNDISTDIQAINDIKKALDTGDIGQEGSMFVSETEAANALLEYSGTLRNDAEDLYEIYTDAWDEYLDGIDQVVNKWEKVIDEFDAINDSIEHQIKVVELLYKDGAAARNANAQLYDVNNANKLAEMSTLNSIITALQNEREQLLAAGAKETDEDVQKIAEAIKSNQQTLQSAIENYLNGLADQFTNAVNIAMSTMESTLTGGSSYDTITQHWEDAQYAAKGYYDEVERIYQLESLETKWESAISSSSSLKAQQKLKELMDEQLENLQSKTELTEYDIELAEKQLAVAQAQIALEEAQNNKNSMKLTRGTDGNWSYQYVADEDDVKDKQQSLLDANHEWYEFTKTSWQDLTEEIWKDVKEAQERIAELMEEYNTADTERREQIAEELDHLYEYYYGEDGLIAVKSTELAEYQQNLNAATMNDLWALYDIDEENYALMTENEKALMNSLKEEGINSYNLLKDAVAGNGGVYEQMEQKCEEINKESLTEWEQTAKKVIDAWVNDPTSVQNTLKNAYATVKQAQQDYDKAVAEGIKASGVNYTNLATQISNLNTKISDTTKKTTELIDETDKISDMASAVAKLENKWYDVQDAISGAIYNLAQYLALLTGENVSYSIANGRGSSSSDSGSSGSGNNSGSSSTSGASGSGSAASDGGATASADTIEGIAAAIWMDGAASGWGNDPIRSGLLKEKFNAETAAAVQAYINAHGPNGDIYDEWASKRDKLKNYYTSSFDTGGYTGEWDDGSGKLAFLHSKELVLNAEDTENMLQAVNAVRSIASISNSITESVANGVANMVKSLLGVAKTSVAGVTSNNTPSGDNNTFNITAEFPNAENVEDIREAIMSLPTLASQYLSQRKL